MTTIFSMGGKTYIGTIGPAVDSTATGNIARCLSPTPVPTVSNEEYVYIQKPALLEYSLAEKSDSPGNYELRWTVTPLMFASLLQSQALAHNVFLFKRSDISFSGIDASADLKKEVLSAYKELV